MIFRPSDHRAYAGNVMTDPLTLLQRRCLIAILNPLRTGLANNFKRLGNEPDNQDQFDIRIDHRFRERDQVFGRYSYFKDFTQPVTPLTRWSGTIGGTSALGPQDTLAQSIVWQLRSSVFPEFCQRTAVRIHAKEGRAGGAASFGSAIGESRNTWNPFERRVRK